MNSHSRPASFFITQEDLDQIDTLIGLLNRAVTEILAHRKLRERRARSTPAQDEYDEHIHAYIDTAEYVDPRQSQFEF